MTENEEQQIIRISEVPGSARSARIPILGKEFKTKKLPQELINADGSLKLYDDVRKLFTPVFEDGFPAIQFGGWIGYIPLNEDYALEVSPRVPIGNLERLVRIALDYTPNILSKYTRQFAGSDERPTSILNLLIDRLLETFNRIYETGFLKTYANVERIGAHPSGRIDPYKSAWQSKKMGRPVAISSAFQRTIDFAPNRIIKAALETLYRHCQLDETRQRRRIVAIQSALSRLSRVGSPTKADVDKRAIARLILRLPSHHEHYAEAITLSQLIVSGSGITIRGNEGPTTLPSILIDMTKVFEKYIRAVLAEKLQSNPRFTVKDGNTAGPEGAKVDLFDPIEPGIKNSPVTPDIVVEVDGVPRLIIEIKYKASPKKPERENINQAVLYGAKYGTSRVMLLHAGRLPDAPHVALLGNVGTFQVYNGSIDLAAPAIDDEETALGNAIGALL